MADRLLVDLAEFRKITKLRKQNYFMNSLYLAKRFPPKVGHFFILHCIVMVVCLAQQGIHFVTSTKIDENCHVRS